MSSGLRMGELGGAVPTELKPQEADRSHAIQATTSFPLENLPTVSSVKVSQSLLLSLRTLTHSF